MEFNSWKNSSIGSGGRNYFKLLVQLSTFVSIFGRTLRADESLRRSDPNSKTAVSPVRLWSGYKLTTLHDKIMSDFEKFFNNMTSVSTESWDRFSVLFKPRVLKKGDYFIKEGQIAKELAFLETGIIRVFYRSDKGIEYNKQFFVNPCLIGGYSSLITKLPTQINQQALTNCNILVAKYSEIQAFYSSYPDIERVARILAEYYFVEKEQREIEIVLLDAEKRYHIFQKQFPLLEQQIPQYHIASYLGITPTQLSRIRKKLSTK